MPLNKADLGDFSQSDPYYEIMRSLMDYGALKNVRTEMGGRRSTHAAKGFENIIPRNPPTRIDIAKLLAAQQPAPAPIPAAPIPRMRQTPQMMAQPTDTVQAEPWEPGGTPMPGRSPNRMGIPERAPSAPPPMPAQNMQSAPMPAMNPNFHDIESAEATPDNELAEGEGMPAPGMGSRPELQRMALLLAGSKQRPPFTQPGQWAAMSPDDLARNQPWQV